LPDGASGIPPGVEFHEGERMTEPADRFVDVTREPAVQRDELTQPEDPAAERPGTGVPGQHDGGDAADAEGAAPDHGHGTPEPPD
jgi:hypothetical protein